MFNGSLIVLLLVHSYRNNPSLAPIDNAPGVWPIDRDITTQTKTLGIAVNHGTMLFSNQGVGIEEEGSRADLLRTWPRDTSRHKITNTRKIRKERDINSIVK